MSSNNARNRDLADVDPDDEVEEPTEEPAEGIDDYFTDDDEEDYTIPRQNYPINSLNEIHICTEDGDFLYEVDIEIPHVILRVDNHRLSTDENPTHNSFNCAEFRRRENIATRGVHNLCEIIGDKKILTQFTDVKEAWLSNDDDDPENCGNTILLRLREGLGDTMVLLSSRILFFSLPDRVISFDSFCMDDDTHTYIITDNWVVFFPPNKNPVKLARSSLPPGSDYCWITLWDLCLYRREDRNLEFSPVEYTEYKYSG